MIIRGEKVEQKIEKLRKVIREPTKLVLEIGRFADVIKEIIS